MEALLAFQNPLLSTLQHLANLPDESDRAVNASSRAYVQDAKAIASTPADVKELPAAYEFAVDMPGVKPGEISVQVEDDNVLVISGERRRDEGKDSDERGGKYLRLERRMGKFMRRFALPENANAEAISAVCGDGVLVVTVAKRPPPGTKKPKTIEVKCA